MSNQQKPTLLDFEAEVGRKVRALREAKGLSQAQLGQRMAELGYPMEQPTIYKLERGVRPLRLNEVAALATIFGTTVPALMRTDEDRKETEALHKVVTTMRELEALATDHQRLVARRHQLAREQAQLEERIREVMQQHAELQAIHNDAVARLDELRKRATKGANRGEHPEA